MKTTKFLFILLLLCTMANAQDMILKTDQTEVSAKVIEITPEEVKFKYFNRLDGPTYSLKKAEVFVIIYKDGTREKFSSAAVESNLVPVIPARTDSPSSPSQQYISTPAIQSAPVVAEVKRKGWTGSFGYTTPVQGIGNASGITYGTGYYFLGSGRKSGILVDVDVMNFFGEGSPNYGIIALNGIFRTSNTSNFYMSAGAGYATVSVKLKDRYGSTTTVSSGDFGAKAFMGYGLFRIGIVWPSTESIGVGGLWTVGLFTNPFK
ncbi:hypothetical protein [Spirosoma pulveris]